MRLVGRAAALAGMAGTLGAAHLGVVRPWPARWGATLLLAGVPWARGRRRAP